MRYFATGWILEMPGQTRHGRTSPYDAIGILPASPHRMMRAAEHDRMRLGDASGSVVVQTVGTVARSMLTPAG